MRQQVRAAVRRRSFIVTVLVVAVMMLSLTGGPRVSPAPTARAHVSSRAKSSGTSYTIVAGGLSTQSNSRAAVSLVSNVVSGSLGVTKQGTRNPALRLKRLARYPIGILDAAQPSGRAPPASNAMAGFRLIYENGFTGSTLPAGWVPYSGVPGGDAGGQFAPSHVVVSNGLLQLNTWQDPSFNNEWVTGGLCQCGVAHTYGAYFVRSRITGAGPTAVELLWPVARVWPPEIDFSETGGTTWASSATLHFNSANQFVQRKLSIDMTQWHTWGVIWTPTSVVYTVDGRTWGVVNTTTEIPRQPMTLDLQQQTWCASGWACPTQPQSLQVDWVAEYAPS
ncbi:MAG: glycoside hydrolase family 16 protein [Acidobacteria bacterium]|nr:glycoside hydrolase family 16 protein [Acidobacteriota bacterium]